LKNPKDEEGKRGAWPYIVVNPESSKRICTLCNIELDSAVSEEQHLKGIKHKKKMKRKRLGKMEWKASNKLKFGRCNICNIKYTTWVMKKSHLRSNKHLVNAWKRRLPVRPVKRRAADITSDANLAGALPGQNNKILSKPPQKMPKLQEEKMQKLQTIKLEKPEPTTLQVPAYQVLEKQAEDAFKKYAETTAVDPSSGATLYIEYQNIYRAYEASYDRYVREANTNALEAYDQGRKAPREIQKVPCR